MDEQAYINALIQLHVGLDRQGPGDEQFSRELLGRLPPFQAPPRIADMGCGAGEASLMLADYFGSIVLAVDFSDDFLAQLSRDAASRGLLHLIEPVRADMGALDWPEASIDLLWSEGAAYSIGFANALTAWRPLMASGAVAVVSEMNYFGDSVPETLVSGMQSIYPDIQTEVANRQLIEACGFKHLETSRLPAEAWWDNYYGPLKGNIERLRNQPDPVMQQVIKDTEAEMQFMSEHGEQCGYSFYLMQVD